MRKAVIGLGLLMSALWLAALPLVTARADLIPQHYQLWLTIPKLQFGLHSADGDIVPMDRKDFLKEIYSRASSGKISPDLLQYMDEFSDIADKSFAKINAVLESYAAPHEGEVTIIFDSVNRSASQSLVDPAVFPILFKPGLRDNDIVNYDVTKMPNDCVVVESNRYTQNDEPWSQHILGFYDLKTISINSSITIINASNLKPQHLDCLRWQLGITYDAFEENGQYFFSSDPVWLNYFWDEIEAGIEDLKRRIEAQQKLQEKLK